MTQQRDRRIFNDLQEHKVLTTHHLANLHFDSERRAIRRLLKLHRSEAIRRFRPKVQTGSLPHHYVLSEIGARILAAERGVDLKELPFRKDQDLRAANSPQLAHLLDINTFFTKLAWACRQSADHVLSEWMSEDRARKQWGDFVLPDGIGRLQSSSRDRTFFLELDRATERPWRLERKLAPYKKLSPLPEAPDLLLFCFPDSHREISARSALYACGIPVATATLDRHIADPLGRNWLSLEGDERCSILEVPTDD
ncbi:MAG: replication-relaxation family protein [Actinobacteria bacterium]|nr:replication-relaxation family protein [Actinomycetota bacterium]